MFFDFIKSISFHLLIIFSFLVFDSFYDFSRRNVVTEIPIEVVDVSEKTKVKKKKSEKKGKRTWSFHHFIILFLLAVKRVSVLR